jgi:hypothetical protein
MALIPRYHVVADYLPVLSTAEIIMGSFVKFDADGFIVQATGAAQEYAYGIAGDTKSSSTSGMPSTNDAILGAGGVSQSFVNRVSDGLTDETKASAKMTVYHSGGKFATDQYDTTGSYVPGAALYVGANGKLQTSDAGSGQIVARTVSEGPFPSGVPGIDTDGDITLGDYLVFKMVI